ncbi:hypothetical protein [Spirillospora sp. CA-294931]|uniref:hypothetical protein n=1 Tax=Spirillospora sp. CA-294931 TaxID=3240042 RepID=UPI003D8DC33C
MPTLLVSGTQTATINTEHELAVDTSNKTYVLAVDTAALAAGDLLELRLYTKILAGGAERLAYVASYQHAQGQPAVYSVPVPANVHLRATLKQVAGTARSFPWSLLALG